MVFFKPINDPEDTYTEIWNCAVKFVSLLQK